MVGMRRGRACRVKLYMLMVNSLLNFGAVHQNDHQTKKDLSYNVCTYLTCKTSQATLERKITIGLTQNENYVILN